MKYLALIYGDEQQMMTATPEAQQKEFGDYMTYNAGLAARPGKMLAGEALQPTVTAKTIRTRNGKTTITDGPFAETKEHLGGFYLLDAESMEEAIELSKGIPGALHGSVEVRPCAVLDMP